MKLKNFNPIVNMNPETTQANISLIYLDSAEVISYSDLRSAILKQNILTKMNQQLASQVLEDVKKEQQEDSQLLESLRRSQLPSANQTIEELQQRVKRGNDLLKTLNDYISLKCRSLEVQDSGTNGKLETPKALRDNHLRELLANYPVETPFDIETIRNSAIETYGKLFAKKDDFYGIYWRVINEFKEQGKLRLIQQGKGRRPTVFARIAETNEKP